MSLNQSWLNACWFCGMSQADGQSAVEVGMYKVTTEKEAKNNQSLTEMMNVEWENSVVAVPRCMRCKSVHERRKYYADRGWHIGLLIGAVVGTGAYFVWAYFAGWLISIYVVLKAASVGSLIGWGVSRAFISRDVREQKRAVEYPYVKRREVEGWGVGNEPTGGE